MSSHQPGRRIAERPSRSRRASKHPRQAAAPTRAPAADAAPRPVRPVEPRGEPGALIQRVVIVLWPVVTALGIAALVCALMDVGPAYLSDAGAVAVSTTFTYALAARVGGRPVIYGALALVLGLVTIFVDRPFLRGGAAVLTVALTAVFAVMATVPAVRFPNAVREAVVAVLISAAGALAVVGFEPKVALERFEYLTLGLAFLVALGLVYRLGAGLHGLGRRGALLVLVGGGALALTLVYAEMLRRYGTPTLVQSIFDGVRWTRENLGAVPRPMQFLIGIPALVWGCHVRARRRQGWWVCAFGVAATSSVASGLMNPDASVVEAALIVAYSLVIGLVLGYLVIRVDLALTGSRGGRARREEEQAAVRPEPSRLQPLL